MGEKLRGDSPKPAFNRFLRTTSPGKLCIDRRAVARDAQFDGKFLLRTSDKSLSAADFAEGYKALYEAEDGFRDVKSTIDLRPVFHHKEQRILSHVQLWLLLRVAETELGDTWRNIRDELARLHLVTPAHRRGHRRPAWRTTARHKQILRRLRLPEPPRFHDFAPSTPLTPDHSRRRRLSVEHAMIVGFCPAHRPNSPDRVPTICGSRG